MKTKKEVERVYCQHCGAGIKNKDSICKSCQKQLEIYMDKLFGDENG